MREHCITWIFLAGAAAASPAWSAPEIPINDDVVLAVVEKAADASAARARDLRAQLQRDASDDATARELIALYLQRARATGDARYTAYAQHALAPWWSSASLPSELRFTRAQVKQALHDFDGALLDLDRVLHDAAGHADALLLRATLLVLRGEQDRARHDCTQLAQRVDPLTGLICSAATSVSKDAIVRSLRVLDGALPQARARDAAFQQWTYFTLADLASRLGDWDRARRYIDESATVTALDLPARALRADALLALHRPHAVVAMISEPSPADALLARKIAALRLTNDPALRDALALADTRLRESQARPVPGHERDLTLLLIEAGLADAEALHFARANWQQQREAIDAYALLRAAERRADTTARVDIATWLNATGFYDLRVLQLLDRKESAS